VENFGENSRGIGGKKRRSWCQGKTVAAPDKGGRAGGTKIGQVGTPTLTSVEKGLKKRKERVLFGGEVGNQHLFKKGTEGESRMVEPVAVGKGERHPGKSGKGVGI